MNRPQWSNQTGIVEGEDNGISAWIVWLASEGVDLPEVQVRKWKEILLVEGADKRQFR